MMGTCIYCTRHRKFTKSHVVPECLGADIILHNAVCVDCNNSISKIEAKICDDLSFYRLITRIKTKGKYAVTKAELNVFDHEIPVEIRVGGVKGYVRPIIEEGPPRYFRVVAETPEKLKKYMEQFTKTGVEFDEERISKVEVKLVFKGKLINIDSVEFLRVVAKIAFERFCQRRYSQAFYKELDPVREFILNGKQISGQVAFLLFEEKLINKILDIPFPYHGILLYGFKNQVAAIVIIFGLFYYYIILNRNAYYLLKDWDEFIYVDPTTKKYRRPLYYSHPSFPRLRSLIEKSLRDRNVFEKATGYAREQFNLFLEHIQEKKTT